MRTVADPIVLQSLKQRLGRVRPDSPRRWGTLTPHEMLCHLGDAAAMVLRTRPRTVPIPQRRRPIVKALALWLPVRWPHGWPTNPLLDPRAQGTRPSEFTEDLLRAIAGIDGIAAAAPDALDPAHGLFGTMSLRDWQRWAYRHTDHHLRQFGL
jgi:hypothetical protein